MNHKNFKKKDRPLIWAHRGASGYAPENTMISCNYSEPPLAQYDFGITV